MSTPTLAQLERAIQITKQIEALEAEIAAIFKGSPAPKAAVKAKATGKSKKSAAQKAPAAATKAPAKKRHISAAHRAKLAAAAKARWARIRAGKEPSPVQAK